MRPLRLVLALAALSGLSACTSVAERRYNDEGRCRSYGFRPGSDAFAACLQNIDLDRSADRREFLGRPGFGYGYGYGVGFGFRGRGW